MGNVCCKPSDNEASPQTAQPSGSQRPDDTTVRVKQPQKIPEPVTASIADAGPADIKLRKFGNDETFAYSIVRLEGKIGSGQGAGSTSIHSSVQWGSEKAESQGEWPVIKGHFKVLVHLSKGKNKVKLQTSTGHTHSLDVLNDPTAQNEASHSVRLIYYVQKDDDRGYFTPSSKPTTVEDAIERIQMAGLMMQCFCATNLRTHGLGSFTFALEMMDDGRARLPKVHVVSSQISRKEMRTRWHTGGDNWGYAFVAEDLRKTFPEEEAATTKDIVFLSATEYDKKKQAAVMHTALGGGRQGLFGGASLHCWPASVAQIAPCFLDEKTVDKKTTFDDSGGRGKYWAMYSTTLGATMHEAGHMFGLPHIYATTTGNGIMARGFDYFNRFFLAKEPNQEKAMLIPEERRGGTWIRASALHLRHSEWFVRMRSVENAERDFHEMDVPNITLTTASNAQIYDEDDEQEVTGAPTATTAPAATPTAMSEAGRTHHVDLSLPENAGNGLVLHSTPRPSPLAGMSLVESIKRRGTGDLDASLAQGGGMNIVVSPATTPSPKPVPTARMAPPEPDEDVIRNLPKSKFHYKNTAGGGFVYLPGEHPMWAEIEATGAVKFLFEVYEPDKRYKWYDPDSVYMEDASRGFYVRISDNDGVTLSADGHQTWKKLCSGAWADDKDTVLKTMARRGPVIVSISNDGNPIVNLSSVVPLALVKFIVKENGNLFHHLEFAPETHTIDFTDESVKRMWRTKHEDAGVEAPELEAYFVEAWDVKGHSARQAVR
ncbi:hypothetical protein SARC_05146 [Sphaeroforma arctica JP610]|uniref:Uncharacterized protein n=1 Tax=Sphaeroforma arctica JP610 TaxID=667725 RepID=A0A0L0G0F9_9EUKA|nr:hypothetical protein SARC_05146 [Sphaeroforma arctica JP610]KNC82572.1 hypothetical protein SARC_05146 [Sphaeroforma arctica JP610]|eukprot:XP_014156474.1 hypothetical protein SARC_05146 [Sphaeroforma arctica JP610]